MAELGQLEARHADFAARNTRIAAVSLDGLEDTAAMQKRFPHLVLVSDAERSLAEAAGVMGPQHSPLDGSQTVSPTTVLVDPSGKVRWLFRADRYLERLPADELLAKVGEHLNSGSRGR
jgi:peroxiredoxin